MSWALKALILIHLGNLGEAWASVDEIAQHTQRTDAEVRATLALLCEESEVELKHDLEAGDLIVAARQRVRTLGLVDALA